MYHFYRVPNVTFCDELALCGVGSRRKPRQKLPPRWRAGKLGLEARPPAWGGTIARRASAPNPITGNLRISYLCLPVEESGALIDRKSTRLNSSHLGIS